MVSTSIKSTFDEAIKDTRISFFLKDFLPDNLEIYSKAGFETACWRYDEKKEKNVVIVGHDLISKHKDFDPKRQLEKDAMCDYIALYIKHEFGHAHFTDRDLDKFVNLCSDNKVPFSLFNLFEDARMEQKTRDFLGERFGWAKYELHNKADLLRPEQCIFYLVQTEGDDSLEVEHERAQWYYDELTACSDTQGAFELADKFSKEFDLQDNGSEQQQIRMSDLEGLLEMMNTLSDLGESLSVRVDSMVENGELTEGVSGEPSGDDGSDSKGKLEVDFVPDFSIESITVDCPRPISECIEGYNTGYFSENLDLRLLNQARKILKGFNRKQSTATPKKRISAKKLALDVENIYQKKIENDGRQKFAFAFDLSGSMSGYPFINGVKILRVFHELSKTGLVEGDVYFISEGEYLNVPLKSLTSEFVDSLYPNGGSEGFGKVFKAIEKKLEGVDKLFCITDGSIDDSVYKMRRTKTIGLYVADERLSADNLILLNDNLKKWFDASLVRSSLDLIFADLIKLR